MPDYCPKCERDSFGRIGGFFHDLRCWGLGTAIYNLRFALAGGFDDDDD